jgi:hypothetical protein
MRLLTTPPGTVIFEQHEKVRRAIAAQLPRNCLAILARSPITIAVAHSATPLQADCFYIIFKGDVRITAKVGGPVKPPTAPVDALDTAADDAAAAAARGDATAFASPNLGRRRSLSRRRGSESGGPARLDGSTSRRGSVDIRHTDPAAAASAAAVGGRRGSADMSNAAAAAVATASFSNAEAAALASKFAAADAKHAAMANFSNADAAALATKLAALEAAGGAPAIPRRSSMGANMNSGASQDLRALPRMRARRNSLPDLNRTGKLRHSPPAALALRGRV